MTHDPHEKAVLTGLQEDTILEEFNGFIYEVRQVLEERDIQIQNQESLTRYALRIGLEALKSEITRLEEEADLEIEYYETVNYTAQEQRADELGLESAETQTGYVAPERFIILNPAPW